MCGRLSRFSKDAICPVCNTPSIPCEEIPSCEHIVGIWDGDHFHNVSPKLTTLILANASCDDESYFDDCSLTDSAINIHSLDEVLDAIEVIDGFAYDMFNFDDGEAFYFLYNTKSTI